jgi:hypothetical protein
VEARAESAHLFHRGAIVARQLKDTLFCHEDFQAIADRPAHWPIYSNLKAPDLAAMFVG